jgi:hypothetical protein
MTSIARIAVRTSRALRMLVATMTSAKRNKDSLHVVKKPRNELNSSVFCFYEFAFLEK